MSFKYENADCPTGEPLLVTIVRDDKKPKSVKVTHLFPLIRDLGPAHAKLLDRIGGPSLQLTGRATLAYEEALKGATDHLRQYFKPPPLNTPDPSLFQTPLIPIADIELSNFLGEFSHAGYEVYSALFELFEPVDRQLSRNDFRDAKTALAEYLSVPRRINISIFPEFDILYPWGLLFNKKMDVKSKNTSNSLDYIAEQLVRSCFGLRHQIEERFIWSAGRERGFAGPHRRVIAAIDPKADPLGWHRIATHPLQRRAATDQVDFINSVPAFQTELRNCDADVVYFFGHGEIADDDHADQNWLSLDARRLTAEDLQREDGIVYRREIILTFLNACQTVPLRYLTTLSILGQFTVKEAHKDCRIRCVATTGRIPSGFGASFGEEFWAGFLPSPEGLGKPLWAALHYAKRRMLEKYNNPLGLLYTLLGSGNLEYRDLTAPQTRSSAG